MKYNGKIQKVGELASGISSASGQKWYRRYINVEIPDNDPEIAAQVHNVIQVSFTGDQAVALGDLAAGDQVDIGVGFGVRTFGTNEYPTCYGWWIRKEDGNEN